tara:strand:- start:1223 stop:1474 length:252 start_codon:yes stop_codon:yes gene_type:complete
LPDTQTIQTPIERVLPMNEPIVLSLIISSTVISVAVIWASVRKNELKDTQRESLDQTLTKIASDVSELKDRQGIKALQTYVRK